MSGTHRRHVGGGRELAGMSAVGPPQGTRPLGGAAGSDARGEHTSYGERALTFECCEERLVGVLAEPAASARVGLLIVVGGPQYRAGSHRQFVALARRLAAAGVAVLRFDSRGMGDSTGPARSFEDSGPDIAAAIDALQAACPVIERIVLCGLCDAASSALIYWNRTADARVAGMVLLNPWVRSSDTSARAELKHYYGARLLEKEFWGKLVRGRVDVVSSARTVAARLVAARLVRGGAAPAANEAEPGAYQDRMAEGLRTFPGPVLLLLSGRDLTAREFLECVASRPRWSGLLDRSNVERHDLPDADHTFSTARWRDEVETRTLDWLGRTLDVGHQ